MTGYLKTLVALVVALMATVGDLRGAEAQEYDAKPWVSFVWDVMTAPGWISDPRVTRGVGDWGFSFGDSAEAAESAGKERCRSTITPNFDYITGDYYTLESYCTDAVTESHSCIAVPLIVAEGLAIIEDTIGVGDTASAAETLALERLEDWRDSVSGRWPLGSVHVACAGMAAAGMAAEDAEPAQWAQWGALAFGRLETADGTESAWAFGFGDDDAAAERAALDRCADRLGSPCESWDTFSDSCRAIAVSACPAGCTWPAYGADGGVTRDEAITRAVASCEDAASGSGVSGVSGTCRLAIGDEGRPGVHCVGSAQGRDGGGGGGGQR